MRRVFLEEKAAFVKAVRKKRTIQEATRNTEWGSQNKT